MASSPQPAFGLITPRCESDGNLLITKHGNSAMPSLQMNLQGDVVRRVSLNLLPVNEKKFTEAWAKSTYKYCHLFDPNVQAIAYNGNSDVEDWRLLGIKLMKSIKQQGVNSGHNEIVRMAQLKYNLTMPGTKGDQPTNVDDVITIISDPKWYNEGKCIKQDMIYCFIYGITRRGMNSWIVKAEKDWLSFYNIVYEEVTSVKRKKKLRGFVYSLLMSLFSNSIISLFQTVMKRNHNEYITVRERPNTNDSFLSFVQRDFQCGKGYIVQCKHQVQVDDSNLQKINQNGEAFIKKCKQSKIPLKTIHNMINSWYFRCYEKDVIAHTESISSNTVNPSNINSYGKYSYILFFKMKH